MKIGIYLQKSKKKKIGKSENNKVKYRNVYQRPYQSKSNRVGLARHAGKR